MKYLTLSSIAMVCMTTGWVQGAADVFSEPTLAEIRRLHDTAIEGNKQDVARAETVITQALNQNPTNQLYRVYLGSLLTIKSGKAFPGPAKLHYLKEGLSMMDTAVNADPNNAAVRFVRAINNYMLPRFINRRDNATKDFLTLIEAIKNPQTALQFNQPTLQAIYYYGGLALKGTREKEQAVAVWEKGLAMGEKTDFGTKIFNELKKLAIF